MQFAKKYTGPLALTGPVVVHWLHLISLSGSYKISFLLCAVPLRGKRKSNRL